MSTGRSKLDMLDYVSNGAQYETYWALLGLVLPVAFFAGVSTRELSSVRSRCLEPTLDTPAMQFGMRRWKKLVALRFCCLSRHYFT